MLITYSHILHGRYEALSTLRSSEAGDCETLIYNETKPVGQIFTPKALPGQSSQFPTSDTPSLSARCFRSQLGPKRFTRCDGAGTVISSAAAGPLSI